MSANSLPTLTEADDWAERQYFAQIELARIDRDKQIAALQTHYDKMCAIATRVYLKALDHG